MILEISSGVTVATEERSFVAASPSPDRSIEGCLLGSLYKISQVSHYQLVGFLTYALKVFFFLVGWLIAWAVSLLAKSACSFCADISSCLRMAAEISLSL